MNPRLTLNAVCFIVLLAALCDRAALCQGQKPRLVVQTGHSEAIEMVSFSPDGKTIASGSYDGTVKIWDVKTGALIRTLQGPHGGIFSLSFSPDSKTLATGMNQGLVRLWSVETGKLRRILEESGNEWDAYVSFSPDGKALASGSRDGSVKIWNVDTGDLKKTLESNSGVEAICFSPDGKTLATGSGDKVVKFWNVETGDLARTITGHTDTIISMSFSPNGKILATGSDDKTVKLWNIETGKVISTLEGHTDGVTSVSFSSDGTKLASGSADNTVKLWQVNSGALIRTLKWPASKSVSFSPDGMMLATGSLHMTVNLYSVDTGTLLRKLGGHTDAVHSLSFSPDGKTLLSGSSDGKWDGSVKVWSIETGALKKTLANYRDIHSMSVSEISSMNFRDIWSMTFSSDSRTFADGFSDGTIEIWDADTGTLLRTLKGHTNLVSSLCFSPNGKTLASGSWDGSVKIWNLDTGAMSRTLDAQAGWGSSLSFSSDGETLAAGTAVSKPFSKPFKLGSSEVFGSEKGSINLWNIKTGTLTKMFEPNMNANCVSFSPDGRVLASGSDGTVKLWSVETGDLETVLKGQKGSIRSLCFSPDGKKVASGSSNGTVQVWSVGTHAVPAMFDGHSGPVYTVIFSPDGKTLVSGSENEEVKIWRVETGAEICSIYTFEDNDGNWLITDTNGRFDASNLDSVPQLRWVLPSDPMTPVPIEAFFRQYYTPGLLAHLMHNDPLPPLPDISTINHVQPQVAIDSIDPHPGDDPALVDVTVSYSGQEAEAIRPDGTKKTETSGVYDLRLFRDGQLVAALPEDAAPGAAPTDLAQGTVGKTLTHTFTVRLAQDGAKSVPFTAYAFNCDKVKSQTASRDYAPPQPLAPVKGRAWVLAFGVDAYEDPHWDLRYAAADARAFGEQLVPRLQQTGQYAQVTFVPLVSTVGKPVGDALPATKAALRAALMALAGKAPDAQAAPFASALHTLGVGRAAPEDMVLLAFSCHGDADPHTGEYYLFPADIGPDQSRGLTPDLESRSLSSAELTGWMQGVDAGEMAMVIDSCHSAAAAGEAFKPGPMDSPGLGQLAYYKRMRILSASAADAVAKEYPDLGHGLLTAALVGDGLVNGGAKPGPGQSVLTLGPWLRYAEGDVPALDARERGRAGHKEVVMVENGKAEAPDAGLQRPSLFDFHRADAPDAAVSGAAAGGVKAP